ncbi:MAG: nitrogenase cofactor biosynthesis protein NifB [Candidatus Accumulibacter sp.]|nr:nitrogenase cofactor biosynthesis protein NifB [Accumulibacter sp.]
MDLPVNESFPRAAAGCGAGSCGATAGQIDGLTDAIRARIEDHPCYSEDAHHYFARMHVAVAPACNIQCHYCNRKYDCANESRPGVVSELLTPDQAVRKTLAVAARIPQMSVLGIAGPGDPLANPERTFETFRQLAQKAPDIKLCVSTNGLMLPRHVEELCRYHIDHVTITINCVDPDVGARIHPWIFWQNRRVYGRQAAAILVEQQQLGLEMLSARGILVKVNSVLIPGVNDAHLPEVSRIVKAKGAFLHNVMPLIARPEHGTFYGLMGQRSPRPAELQALQDACAGDMKMMRHCRQCRADAVGLLGEDRGAEFTLDRIEAMDVDYEAAMVVRQEVRTEIAARLAAKRARGPSPAVSRANPQVVHFQPRVTKAAATAGRPVLMAVAARGGVVAVHFGHAREFLIYEASAAGARLIGHRRVESYCAGDESCGDADSALTRTIEALVDCEVLLCARIGYEPWGRLEAAGIQPNGEHAMEAVEEAVMAVWQQMLAAGKLTVPRSGARRA